MRQDDRYTKLTADLLVVTRGYCEYGEENGLLTQESLRYTIEARKKEVKKLASAGMSQRQIAKAVGVSKKTVQNDLDRNYPKNGKKLSAKRTKIEAELIHDDDPGDDAQTIWRRGLVARSCGAIANAQHEDWSEFTTDDELVATVQQAADAWKKLAAYIRRIHNADKC